MRLQFPYASRTPILLTLAVLVVLATAADAAAPPCVDYMDYMHQINPLREFPALRDVVVHGNYAYAADSGLRILDITDPRHIVEVGSVNVGNFVESLAVSGDYAYLTNAWDGILVVDVTDHSNPIIAGSTGINGSARDIAVQGDYVYVTGMYNIMTIVDVSDPWHPQVAAEIGPGHSGYGIDVFGDYAVVTSGGLHIVDISNPAIPMVVGTMNNPGSITTGVAVVDRTAYVGDRNQGLLVVSFSNPVDPIIVGSLGSPVTRGEVAVAGDLVVLSTSEFQMQTIDVSDPTAPTAVGSVKVRAGLFHLDLRDDIAYLPAVDGLRLMDVSNPSNPPFMGSLELPGWAQASEIVGEYAFVANGNGMLTVDVSDPEQPHVIGGVDTPGSARDIGLSGNYAFIADFGDGLQIVDISDPAQPVLVATLPVESSAMGVCVRGRHAFVTDRYYGLRVVDISHPRHPRISGSLALPGQVWEISVSGRTVFVTGQLDGLHVIDASVPSHPRLLSRIEVDGSVCDAVMANGFALVATYQGTIRVFDMMRPVTPVLTGEARISSYARSLAVAGDFVYVGGDRGVEVVDIRDPHDPVRLNITPTYSASGLTIAGDILYVSDSSAGYHLLPLQCGEASALPRFVDIDVKPDDGTNTINCLSRGVVSVAILSGDGFVAESIDRSTVRFGPNQACEFRPGSSGAGQHADDVDGDGDIDLVLRFRVGDTGIRCGDTEVELTGETLTGRAFRGSDTIHTVPHWPDGDDDDGREIDRTQLAGAARFHRATGCAPNPFNPLTRIWYTLEEPARVTLAIYDVAGRRVVALREGVGESAGHHEVTWSGRDDLGRSVPSGTYFYRLEAGDYVETKRMTLIK